MLTCAAAAVRAATSTTAAAWIAPVMSTWVVTALKNVPWDG
jgi:hypothetical protein